jgi:hypothetical protein
LYAATYEVPVPPSSLSDFSSPLRSTYRYLKSVVMKTSKYPGVSWHAGNKKWYVRICQNRKKQYLGSFDDEHEAARAYVRAYDNVETVDQNDQPTRDTPTKKTKFDTVQNDSILGRQLSTKWDMEQGSKCEWYKGTIVKMERGHVVVHYEEDGSDHRVPYPSTNSKLIEDGEEELGGGGVRTKWKQSKMGTRDLIFKSLPRRRYTSSAYTRSVYTRSVYTRSVYTRSANQRDLRVKSLPKLRCTHGGRYTRNVSRRRYLVG